jgi:hypothetical protein
MKNFPLHTVVRFDFALKKIAKSQNYKQANQIAWLFNP